MSLLEVDRLHVGYGKDLIVRNFSHRFAAGKLTVILGANGCGKSTLLKAMASIAPLTSGRVMLQGEGLDQFSARERAKRLAFLPQHPQAPSGLNTEDLVMMGRFPHRLPLLPPSGKDRAIVAQVMSQLELQSLATRGVETLSGGQRQRVWLAMVLAQQAEVILLDEPTSFLDLAHQYELMRTVREQSRALGKTVVMVLHDLNQAFEFADHIVLLKDGKLFTHGSPEEVARHHVIEQVFGLKNHVMRHPVQHHPICLPLSG